MIFLATKVTDDILIAGSITGMNHFCEQISRKVNVRKVIIEDRIIINGCEIYQNVLDDLRLCMNRELSKIAPIHVDRE